MTNGQALKLSSFERRDLHFESNRQRDHEAILQLPQSTYKHVKRLHLDTSDPSSMEDVSKYLLRKIGKLAEDENLNLEIWPGRERFEMLCVRAAKLFIWVVTVTKFFEEQVRLHGPDCLDDLLDAITAAGVEDVHRLYQILLAITYRSSAKLDLNAWAHETFRWVVGFIIGLKEPLAIGDVGALLELRLSSESKPIDVLRFVTNLTFCHWDRRDHE